jgi:hypothetical protein
MPQVGFELTSGTNEHEGELMCKTIKNAFWKYSFLI